MLIDFLSGVVAAICVPAIGAFGTVIFGAIGAVGGGPFVEYYAVANRGLPLSDVLSVITLVVGIKGAAIAWHGVKEVAKWLPWNTGGGGE